jgi:two-component system, response regulator
MPHGVSLLVEDTTLTAELTMACLRKGEGAANEVVFARDGVEAIEYLFHPERGPSEMPGLVLLGLNMPRMDGFEVLRKMRSAERTRFVPVVTLASSIRAEDVHMAYCLGANGYLDKMSHGVPWHEMVQTAARYWLRMNVTPNSLVVQEDGFARQTEREPHFREPDQIDSVSGSNAQTFLGGCGHASAPAPGPTISRTPLQASRRVAFTSRTGSIAYTAGSSSCRPCPHLPASYEVCSPKLASGIAPVLYGMHPPTRVERQSIAGELDQAWMRSLSYGRLWSAFTQPRWRVAPRLGRRRCFRRGSRPS